MEWDQVHRMAADSSYQGITGHLVTLLGDSETRALSQLIRTPRVWVATTVSSSTKTSKCTPGTEKGFNAVIPWESVCRAVLLARIVSFFSPAAGAFGDSVCTARVSLIIEYECNHRGLLRCVNFMGANLQ